LQWRADKRWWAWFIVGLVVLGLISFIENGDWQSALRAPLGIATFIAVAVVISDFLIWIFGKGKLRKSWSIMFAIAVLLLGLLSLLANPIFLVFFAFLVSCVLLVIGVLKPALYERYGRRRW
jgi:hypothetical protein